MHEGIDLVAPAGTPVYAAADGVVVGAAPNGGYGNWIRIEHGGKLATVYGHLMAFAPGIEPGESVVRGELIGFVGSTGRSTGAHLHFEVLDNGKAVNPINHPELKAMQLRGLDMERFRKQVARSLEERTRESKVDFGRTLAWERGPPSRHHDHHHVPLPRGGETESSRAGGPRSSMRTLPPAPAPAVPADQGEPDDARARTTRRPRRRRRRTPGRGAGTPASRPRSPA